MAAIGVGASVLDVRTAEVERVLESSVLQGSESLCRLMRYLANRTIHNPGSAIREHEIAPEVFARNYVLARFAETSRVWGSPPMPGEVAFPAISSPFTVNTYLVVNA